MGDEEREGHPTPHQEGTQSSTPALSCLHTPWGPPGSTRPSSCLAWASPSPVGTGSSSARSRHSVAAGPSVLRASSRSSHGMLGPVVPPH